ncbi:unnamed protein product [Thelazia callipaeda]|uniref:Meiosis-specific coiled-coil domain-containing protein MEIOC n=1 Tax=Thelazia callipaeda TaxID=103827 RepID=A0A0N5CW71_THECL|nr:unnamed protein product [Thelazia callipaeda]
MILRSVDSDSTATAEVKTIGRYAFGPESLLDIRDIPEQFEKVPPTGSLDARLAAAGTGREKSTETVGRYSFGSHSLADISDVPDLFSSSSDDMRTAASVPDRTIGRHPYTMSSIVEFQKIGDVFSNESSNKSCETLNRRAFTPESISDIQNLPVEFFTPAVTFESDLNAFQRAQVPYGSEEPRHYHMMYKPPSLDQNGSEMSDPIGGINPVSPTTETINRYAYGSGSVTDMSDIPKQFYNKRYFTPNWNQYYPGGNRTVYNLTEQIRQEKEKLQHFNNCFHQDRSDASNECNPYGDGSSQETDMHTINRYAFGEQSLTDINQLPNQFLDTYYQVSKKNPPPKVTKSHVYSKESLAFIQKLPDPFTVQELISKSISSTDNIYGPTFTDPTILQQQMGNYHVYYTPFHLGCQNDMNFYSEGNIGNGSTRIMPFTLTSPEIMEINAHPEFVREDHVIGKKALTREEHEDLRAIPPIVSDNPNVLPIIDRYDMPEDEVYSIKYNNCAYFEELPDIVDSQYTVGRNLRTDEEIREIQALPDFHQIPFTPSSVAVMTAQSHQFVSDLTPSDDGTISAYIAPEMRYQQCEQSDSSEYMMSEPQGTRENNM